MAAINPQVSVAKHINASVVLSWTLAPAQEIKSAIILYITPLNAIVLHQVRFNPPPIKTTNQGISLSLMENDRVILTMQLISKNKEGNIILFHSLLMI